MRRKSSAKIVAIFALLWIILSIIGTWILIFFSWEKNNTETLTQEQLQELINKSNSGAVIETNTWVSDDTEIEE